jgi:hypothetical protein
MKTCLWVLLGSTVYATARYNIFKGVPWNDWPAYTLNKASALASILLIVLGVIRICAPHGRSNDGTLSMASLFAGVHVLLSLTLLVPAYYESFFVQGKLTAAAGVSMTLGAVAAGLMLLGKRTHDQDAERGARNLALLALVVGLHALLQGFAGWFTPALWPGAMPPITLISFLLGLAAVAIAFRPKRSARPRTE